MNEEQPKAGENSGTWRVLNISSIGPDNGIPDIYVVRLVSTYNGNGRAVRLVKLDAEQRLALARFAASAPEKIPPALRKLWRKPSTAPINEQTESL